MLRADFKFIICFSLNKPKNNQNLSKSNIFIKIFLNLNILRTVNDKPNLKEDLNSASKNEQEKFDWIFF